MRHAAIALAIAVALLSCGRKKASTDDGVTFTSKGVRFKHGELDHAWTRAKVDGTSLAFDHAAYHATITAFANCKGIEDISLRALVQQELVGVEKKDVVSKSETDVDGREAADWVVKGELDGVTVSMNLVVMRQGGCVYDMVLVSTPDTFEKARPDFQAFVKGFEVLP